MPAWVVLLEFALCTCFLGLYALWSGSENQLIPEVLEKLHNNSADFVSALGLSDDNNVPALTKPMPTSVQLPLVNSKPADFAGFFQTCVSSPPSAQHGVTINAGTALVSSFSKMGTEPPSSVAYEPDVC